MLIFYKKNISSLDNIVQVHIFDVFNEQQKKEFLQAFPELGNNTAARNVFLDVLEASLRAQRANNSYDIVALVHGAALQLSKGEYEYGDKIIGFDEAVGIMHEHGTLDKYIKETVLDGEILGGQYFVDETKAILTELQEIFPELRGKMAELPRYIGELQILLERCGNASEEEKQVLIIEINKIMEDVAKSLLHIYSRLGHNANVKPELKGRIYGLTVEVLGRVEIVRRNYNRGDGRPSRGDRQVSNSETQLTILVYNTISEDKEGAACMSASALNIFNNIIVPLAIAYELEAKHNAELNSVLIRLKSENPYYYAQCNNMRDVIDRIIKLSSNIAEFIRAKNEQINAEMLLKEKRQELAELEIFNLPKPVLNLIASMLGIDAKYLDPAVLKDIAEQLQNIRRSAA